MHDGLHSGHIRVFIFSFTTNKWNPLGNAIVGATSEDFFGQSVQISAGGKNFATGAPRNNDGRRDSGNVRICIFENMILTKEFGWCANHFDNIQENGIVELSKDIFEQLVEKNAESHV